MVSVASLLVVVCAVAVKAQNYPNVCTTAVNGVTANAIPLQPVTLLPHIADWEITVPTLNCGVVGVKAVACDTDVPPTVTFITQNLIFIHRNGNLEGYGIVHVTVYCTGISVDSSAGTDAPTLVEQVPKSLILRPY